MTNSSPSASFVSSKTKITCIIPVWNEEKYLQGVLERIVKYPRFDEIIIVNDGSKDRTEAIAKEFVKNNPKMRLISHEVNKGKAAAVITAINAATSELIVMLDADLLSLKDKHIDDLIKPVLEGKYSMTVLDRASDRRSIIGFLSSVFTRLLGGERALWKKDFEAMDMVGNERFGIEVKMNNYYRFRSMLTLSIYEQDLFSVYQLDKWGFWGGIKGMYRIAHDIFVHLGIFKLISQSLAMDEDSFVGLYESYRKSNKFFGWAIAILFCSFVLSTYRMVKINVVGLFRGFAK